MKLIIQECVKAAAQVYSWKVKTAGRQWLIYMQSLIAKQEVW